MGAHHRGFNFHSGEGEDSVLEGFKITLGYTVNGGAIACNNASPKISKNILHWNRAERQGGGIYCTANANPRIVKNIILENMAWGEPGIGGGIYYAYSAPKILKNIIRENFSEMLGGGIACVLSSGSIIAHNIIEGNGGRTSGGGIYCSSSTVTIKNNLITGNTAYSWYGGGIRCRTGSHATIVNNTIADNSAHDHGAGIYCTDSYPVIANTILWGNDPEEIYVDSGDFGITFSNVQGGFSGQGNMNEDPLFVAGPNGSYYLSQIDAGQLLESPCVDRGDPGSSMVTGSTRTDRIQDQRAVDLGFHYIPAFKPGPGLLEDSEYEPENQLSDKHGF